MRTSARSAPFDVAGSDWRPTCGLDALRRRAATLATVRAFFAARDVLEVDTPVLSRHTGTDPNLEPLTTRLGAANWYLETSPEFHMKRLLAAGAPSIYRLGPAFRADEAGPRHNPEFTLLEWYRRGFDLDALMCEVAELVDAVLGPSGYVNLTYAALLNDAFEVGPEASATELLEGLRGAGVELSVDLAASERSTLLDLAFDHACRRLAGRVFVRDYPADQAALARTVPAGAGKVALRFELIVDGVELANGYDELLDVDELLRRASAEQDQRRAQGRPAPPLDEHLVSAQRHGLPACAGVALGIDRLLMLALGVDDIGLAMPFSAVNA